MIQSTQQLKSEISLVIDMLPQEGLKLLAEFIAFLRAKFKLGQPASVKKSSDCVATTRQENLQRIGELIQPVLYEVEWAEIESGRQDRWF
jgi:hypothetical protein